MEGGEKTKHEIADCASLVLALSAEKATVRKSGVPLAGGFREFEGRKNFLKAMVRCLGR